MMFLYPYSSQIDPLHFISRVGRVFVDIDIVQFGAHKVILIVLGVCERAHKIENARVGAHKIENVSLSKFWKWLGLVG